MTVFNRARANVADPLVLQASAAVSAAVEKGELVVLPTDTVYGIGTTPLSPVAVSRLLAAKGRGRHMPPPVLVPDAQSMEEFAHPSEAALELAHKVWPGALTIIVPAPNLKWDLGDVNGTVAVRMPDHPITLAILDSTGPLAMTSANITGKEVALTAGEAIAYFGNVVSVYVDAGKASTHGVASTILDTTGSRWRVLRQGKLTVCAIDKIVPGLPW